MPGFCEEIFPVWWPPSLKGKQSAKSYRQCIVNLVSLQISNQMAFTQMDVMGVIDVCAYIP